jgi:hypothetical protein
MSSTNILHIVTTTLLLLLPSTTESYIAVRKYCNYPNKIKSISKQKQLQQILRFNVFNRDDYMRKKSKCSVTLLSIKSDNDESIRQLNGKDRRMTKSTTSSTMLQSIISYPKRSILFSILMFGSGAILGPFLDTYHSLFGVLQYDTPITWNMNFPIIHHPIFLVTTTWVPVLFGIAGFLIGWLYILLDIYFIRNNDDTTTKSIIDTNSTNQIPSCQSPTPPKILFGIAIFTFQYWLSGVLYQSGIDRTMILYTMTISAIIGFWTLDRSYAGFITSAITAIGGPLIEMVLITQSQHDTTLHPGIGYHYTDLGETGYFPLWIIPIYFLGGPANGNLARGYWTMLSPNLNVELPKPIIESVVCVSCNDTRCTTCPNWYVIPTFICMYSL